MNDSLTKADYQAVIPSGALHVSHAVDLLPRQIWNVLYKNSYENLSKQTIFKIPVVELLQYLNLETHNWEHLTECLKDLVETSVQYNLFEKDKRIWGIFTLLAWAEIKDGFCSYEYATKLKEILKDTQLYGKINLLIQQRFKSKHALSLYELIVDYSGIHRTPWVSLADFRKYMGLEEYEYPAFKRLRDSVINPAIKEINDKSDFEIELHIKKEHTGRAPKVSHVQFSIKKNHDYVDPFQPLKVVNLEETGLELLSRYGIPQVVAEKLVQEYTLEKIQTAIELLKAQKRVKNAGGFLTKALKEGWQMEEYDPKKQKEKEAKEAAIAKQKQQQEKYEKLNDTEKMNYILKTPILAKLKASSLDFDILIRSKVHYEIIKKGIPFDRIQSAIDSIVKECSTK